MIPGEEGQIYFDMKNQEFYIFTNGEWVRVDPHKIGLTEEEIQGIVADTSDTFPEEWINSGS